MAKCKRGRDKTADETVEINGRNIPDRGDMLDEHLRDSDDIYEEDQIEDINLDTDEFMSNTIDPNLINENVILSKLKAHMADMDYADNAVEGEESATAMGAGTKALEFASTAQGAFTVAAGVASTAEGIDNIAAGTASTAQGYSTTASGLASFAQGINTSALEVAALAEGVNTVASGAYSHAEGSNTTASGDASHAEGSNTTASDSAAHAEGYFTRASRFASHAEGSRTVANNNNAHAEGSSTNANGPASHAEGSNTTAVGNNSHTEGLDTRAEGQSAHAEGFQTIARGVESHAEGRSTISNGVFSHAEGQNTVAQGAAAHVEGNLSLASGNYSHAEGFTTRASGLISHAEGNVTIASGVYSHAEGVFTDTANQEGAHIMGRFGDARFPYSWHLANGTDADNRSLAAVIRNDGQGIADQGWVTGNADIAEMFETLTGKAIAPGYFVTLRGDKVRKANSYDKYILGITSAAPAFLGDAEELRWSGKYIRDKWGRIKYKRVVIPETRDQNGNVIVPERTEMQPAINPNWNCSINYTPRSERPEWVPVAALGKVLARDDGTCRVNGYCRPDDGGIATASKKGYRVLKRTGPGQILIWFR